MVCSSFEREPNAPSLPIIQHPTINMHPSHLDPWITLYMLLHAHPNSFQRPRKAVETLLHAAVVSSFSPSVCVASRSCASVDRTPPQHTRTTASLPEILRSNPPLFRLPKETLLCTLTAHLAAFDPATPGPPSQQSRAYDKPMQDLLKAYVFSPVNDHAARIPRSGSPLLASISEMRRVAREEKSRTVPGISAGQTCNQWVGC